MTLETAGPDHGPAARTGRTGPSARHLLAVQLTAGLLTLAILAASGGIVAQLLGEPAMPELRFTPAHGDHHAVRLEVESLAGDRSRAPASIENALLYGPSVVGSISDSMLYASAPVPGQDTAKTWWWREVLAPSSLLDPAPRITLRSVSADGIRLHARDWQDRSISYDPAPVAIPTAVRDGQQWTDSGHALLLGNGGWQPYRRVSTASVPQHPADAAAGCLMINSTTTVDRPDGDRQINTEEQLWCPSRGVVEARGSFGDHEYQMVRRRQPGRLPESPIERPQTPTPAAEWTATPLSADIGDDAFGAVTEPIGVASRVKDRISVDGLGAIHTTAFGSREVVTCLPIGRGRVWAHGWVTPGGSVASVASIGRLTIIGTSERRLQAYDVFGRALWSADLPDVTGVPPVPLPGERLLVTTISGHVLLLDTRTGRELWRQRVPGPISVRPTVDGDAAAILTRNAVIGIDLSDGSVRWTYDEPSQGAAEIVGDVVVVGGFSTLTGISMASGNQIWTVGTLRADLVALTELDGRLVLATTTGTEARSPTDGRQLWHRRSAAVRDVSTAGGRVLAMTDRDVTAFTAAGREIGHWPLPESLDREHRLFATAGGVWAIGRSLDNELAGAWIAPPARDDS